MTVEVALLPAAAGVAPGHGMVVVDQIRASIGQSEDIAFCAETDVSTTVPVLVRGEVLRMAPMTDH